MARTAAAAGETERAEEVLRLALVDSPHYVEAHRAYQNLLDTAYRGHEAQEIYRLFLNRFPDSGELHYLLGRITHDPEEQARLFRAAVDRNPDGYWPNLGLGYALLQERSFVAAGAFFRKALNAQSRSGQAWRFLAESLASRRRFPEALRALTKAAMVQPSELGHPLRSARLLLLTGESDRAFEILRALLTEEAEPTFAPRALLRRILRDEGGEGRLARLRAEETARIIAFPNSPAALSFGGHLAVLAGDWTSAERLLRRALEEGAPPSEAIRDLRRTLFARGRYEEALRIWAIKTPDDEWRREGNEVRDRYEAAAVAVKAVKSGGEDPEALFRLGRALLAVGWVREGKSVLDRCAGLGHPKAAGESQRAARHLAFVRRLRRSLSGEYQKHLKKEDTGDLDSVMESISALSREILGEDLGRGNPVRSYFLVGEVLVDSPDEPSPLVAYFGGFNQVLILGRRAGGTPEAVLMTAVYRNRRRAFQHLGAEVECDFVGGEDFLLESFGEYLGGALLGVALLGRFYANLDKAGNQDFSDWGICLAARKQKPALSRFDSWRARTREEALALDGGNGLAESLVLAAFRGEEAGEDGAPPPSARIASRGVIDHELMHVRDANRYLPVTRHPLASLRLGLSHGFSPTSIEAAMEERAALAALLTSPKPHLDLKQILAFAPYPEARLPHSRGYCRLLKRFLTVLYERPDAFPDLDHGRNLCRQLHRLSAKEIHTVARILAEEEGILE
jgi:tetratricopeptide (TPR) repeat protein